MVPDIAGEDHDEPHQRAMYFAHGDINGFDFWGEAAFPKWSDHAVSTFGRTVFCAVDDIQGGADDGRLWIGADEREGPRGKSGHDHFANVINCVRSRKMEALNAPIEEGHISCALVHLANASYRLGRTLRFDPETEQVVGDDEANRLLSDSDRGYRSPFLVPDEV
jgi:hypothetical protein